MCKWQVRNSRKQTRRLTPFQTNNKHERFPFCSEYVRVALQNHSTIHRHFPEKVWCDFEEFPAWKTKRMGTTGHAGVGAGQHAHIRHELGPRVLRRGSQSASGQASHPVICVSSALASASKLERRGKFREGFPTKGHISISKTRWKQRDGHGSFPNMAPNLRRCCHVAFV